MTILFEGGVPLCSGNAPAIGSAVDGFDPNTRAVVIVLADGKLRIGDECFNVGGQLVYALARLNSDGSVDISFDPGVSLGVVLDIETRGWDDLPVFYETVDVLGPGTASSRSGLL